MKLFNHRLQSLLGACIFITVTLQLHETVATVDPCGDYTELNDVFRSSTYAYPSYPGISDYGLAAGWYRSVSGAGGDMPTSVPSEDHCFPNAIWLNGNLPDIGETVTRTACVRTTDDRPCVRSYEIEIKHCVKDGEEYNVYNLQTPVAADKYCFGEKVPCAAGFGSPTGFEPGCEELSLELPSNPTIRVERKKSRQKGRCEVSVDFLCEFEINSANVIFQVTWGADANPFYYEEVTASPSKLSTDVLQQHGIRYGVDITCSVVVKYKAAQLTGHPYKASFFAGVVTDDVALLVNSFDKPSLYRVDFTVPFMCDQSRCGACDLFLEVNVPNDGSQSGCAADFIIQRQNDINKNKRLVCSDAYLKVTNDENEEFPKLEIELLVEANGINYDGTLDYTLDLRLPNNPELGPWQAYRLPQPQIIIQKPPAAKVSLQTCYFHNDPHAKNFDGQRYEMQKAGIFQLYRHKSLPIEVQGYFKNSGSYSRVAGVAVRAGADLFIVDVDDYLSVRPRFKSCESFELSVQQVPNDPQSEFNIDLPHGGSVIINKNKIEIKSSELDYDKTEGLCGNINGDRSDDFEGLSQSDFANKWRIKKQESLFDGVFSTTENENDLQYCYCNTFDKLQCKSAQAKERKYCVQGSKRKDVTATYLDRCLKNGKRKRREVVYDDDVEDDYEPTYDFDPDFDPPPAQWTNGWTEENATEHCNDFFNNRESVDSCQNTIAFFPENAIENCISDIFITGTTNFTSSHLRAFLTDCVDQLSRNFTLLNTTTSDDDDTPMITSLLSKICLNDCSDHGTCVDGECVCNEPYAGEDCSVDGNHVPFLHDLPFQGLCDKVERPCLITATYGDLFIESESLVCRTQVLDLNGTVVSESSQARQKIEHSQKIFCEIPESTIPYKVKLSVSNNAVSYSDPVDLLVYSSVCWKCSKEAGCSKLSTSCVIEGDCYSPGQINLGNEEEFCDPEQAEYAWSKNIHKANGGPKQSMSLAVEVMTGIFVIFSILQMY